LIIDNKQATNRDFIRSAVLKIEGGMKGIDKGIFRNYEPSVPFCLSKKTNIDELSKQELGNSNSIYNR